MTINPINKSYVRISLSPPTLIFTSTPPPSFSSAIVYAALRSASSKILMFSLFDSIQCQLMYSPAMNRGDFRVKQQLRSVTD